MNWKCTSQFEWGLVSVGHAKESLSPVVWWRELRPCCIGIILQPEFRNPLSWQAHPTFWQLVIGLRRANQEFTCLWSCRHVYNSLYNLPIYWGIIVYFKLFFTSHMQSVKKPCMSFETYSLIVNSVLFLKIS